MWMNIRCSWEGILSDSQFGFRKDRSCNHYLAHINIEAYKASIQGQLLGALFLDIKDTYLDSKLPEDYIQFACKF